MLHLQREFVNVTEMRCVPLLCRRKTVGAGEEETMISFIPPSQQNKWIMSPRCFTRAPSCQGASEQQTHLIYSYKCLVNKHGLLWGHAM